jgi:hypothetical protein
MIIIIIIIIIQQTVANPVAINQDRNMKNEKCCSRLNTLKDTLYLEGRLVSRFFRQNLAGFPNLHY